MKKQQHNSLHIKHNNLPTRQGSSIAPPQRKKLGKRDTNYNVVNPIQRMPGDNDEIWTEYGVENHAYEVVKKPPNGPELTVTAVQDFVERTWRAAEGWHEYGDRGKYGKYTGEAEIAEEGFNMWSNQKEMMYYYQKYYLTAEPKQDKTYGHWYLVNHYGPFGKNHSIHSEVTP